MTNRRKVHVNDCSATTRRLDESFTRREWMGAALLGARLPGIAAMPLPAQNAQTATGAPKEQSRKPIFDSHVHLWKLPRNAPPMSDFATFPPGSVPWLGVDRLVPDYNARAGAHKVDKLVLIESSVGVPPDKIIQSNLWMLQTAAAESKILSVVGNLDVKQPPASFERQAAHLSANKQWVGIRIGAGIFQPDLPRSFSTIVPNVLTNLNLLSKRGLQIDTLGIPGAVLSQIGAAAPGLTIVMDHFAGKPTTFDVEDSWKADMLAAANYDGLNVKVSDVHKLSSQAVTGNPAGLSQFRPVADPTPYAPTLEFLWRIFGEDRLIFGTNWPVSDAGGLLVDSIELQIGILESFLTGQFSGGRDKIMYQNAQRVYGPRK
jgi:predicted TIM-barrel fold metal-dependent hydrolase